MIQIASQIGHKKRSMRLERAGMPQRCLIAIAIFSLTISLATRYCVSAASDGYSQTTASCHAPSPKRQHLAGDGLHWTAPHSSFTLFEPGAARSAVLPAVPPVIALYACSSRHNRPPPSC